MAKALVDRSNVLDHTNNASAGQLAAAFGARVRERASELGLSSSKLGKIAGITKQSMGGYFNGDRLPGADRLFALADALDVDARWLVTGVGAASSSPLSLAGDADWIEVPEYDLHELTAESLGRPIATAPIRRDWLNITYRAASSLWMARLLSDYPAAALEEGALVICRSIKPAELAEGNICLWRVQEKVVIGRFSVVPDAARGDGPAPTGRYLPSYLDPSLGGPPNDLLVPPSRIAEGGPYHLIGRILGVMVRPI